MPVPPQSRHRRNSFDGAVVFVPNSSGSTVRRSGAFGAERLYVKTAVPGSGYSDARGTLLGLCLVSPWFILRKCEGLRQQLPLGCAARNDAAATHFAALSHDLVDAVAILGCIKDRLAGGVDHGAILVVELPSGAPDPWLDAGNRDLESSPRNACPVLGVVPEVPGARDVGDIRVDPLDAAQASADREWRGARLTGRVSPHGLPPLLVQ